MLCPQWASKQLCLKGDKKMTVRQMETASLDNVTYYVVFTWSKCKYFGHSYPTAYKTERNAIKRAEKLFASGDYECVTVRKEEVEKRREWCEYSTSSVVKCFKR